MNAIQFATRAARKVLLPLTPPSLKLPLRYYLDHFEGGHEPELRHLDAICRERNVAVDAGANVGLYSYKLAQLFSKVYAFEINSDVTHDLSAYNPGNIEVVCSGLSSTSGVAILYIPLKGGIPLTGWASLSPYNCPEATEHNTKVVHVKPLDSFGITSVSFIKIDVEGHEMHVLDGAIQTLKESRPVVLVESKEPNLQEVRSLLAALDYHEKSLRELVSVEGALQNYIFIPT